MLFNGRGEESIVWHSLEQILEKMEESVAHGVAVFRTKIVYIRFVLIRQPRFATAEEIVDLQILSQMLLGKCLVVPSFMTVWLG